MLSRSVDRRTSGNNCQLLISQKLCVQGGGGMRDRGRQVVGRGSRRVAALLLGTADRRTSAATATCLRMHGEDELGWQAEGLGAWTDERLATTATCLRMQGGGEGAGAAGGGQPLRFEGPLSVLSGQGMYWGYSPKPDLDSLTPCTAGHPRCGCPTLLHEEKHSLPGLPSKA